MKKLKIALIAPAALPIPNIQGGAIETLSTHLLNKNEEYKLIHFDVYSTFNLEAQKIVSSYKESSFIFYNYKKKDFIRNIISSILFHLSLKRITLTRAFTKFVKKQIKKKNDYDYLLIEGNSYQTFQLKDLGIPIIYHLHTDIVNKSEPNSIKIYNASDVIFVISDFLKRQIKLSVGDDSKVKILKNAIDLSKFQAISENNYQLKASLGIPRENKVMIFCGRVVPIKGVLEAVKAFKIANILNLTFVIVGGSNFEDSKESIYETEIKEFVKTNDINVIFTGYIKQEDLPAYYAMADFSICPSICNEAAGLVIIEALASGLPVITSNMGGIPEYAHFPNCIIVENDNNYIHNLSCSITKMYNSIDRLKKNKLNLSEFSLDNYYQNFINSICVMHE